MLNAVCDMCGALFHVPPSRLRKGARFCSHACASSAKRVPLEERFWTKVDKNGPILKPELGQCWLWTGMRHEHGYGRVWVDGVQQYAHRISFEWVNGPLEDGEEACHRCDYPPCVRPDHLFRGDQRANNEDRDDKDRVRHGEAHASAKLTTADVQKIRTLYATGSISQRKLALAFGVAHQTIAELLLGETWKRV